MFVIIFIIILAILIVSHEFGHFIVAKLSGIRVDEFGLGFPPRVVGKRWGQTTYTLNWISGLGLFGFPARSVSSPTDVSLYFAAARSMSSQEASSKQPSSPSNQTGF